MITHLITHLILENLCTQIFILIWYCHARLLLENVCTQILGFWSQSRFRSGQDKSRFWWKSNFKNLQLCYMSKLYKRIASRFININVISSSSVRHQFVISLSSVRHQRKREKEKEKKIKKEKKTDSRNGLGRAPTYNRKILRRVSTQLYNLSICHQSIHLSYHL